MQDGPVPMSVRVFQGSSSHWHRDGIGVANFQYMSSVLEADMLMLASHPDFTVEFLFYCVIKTFFWCPNTKQLQSRPPLAHIRSAGFQESPLKKAFGTLFINSVV